jgi:splicing factor 3B subunit 3
VEEVTTTGLVKDIGSLLVVRLADDSLLQIHRHGFHHIRAHTQITTQFKAPGKKVIEKCAANARQIILSMAGGTLIYFELNDLAGDVVEKGRMDLMSEISAVDIGDIPDGRMRFPFIAVGSYDGTVRILNVHDPAHHLFADQTLLAMPTSHPHSLCFSPLQYEPHVAPTTAAGTGLDTASGSTSIGHGLFLTIGWVRSLHYIYIYICISIYRWADRDT